MTFCGDPTYLAAGGADADVHLFSPNDGAYIASLSGHKAWFTAVIPLDSSGLASCSEDGTVRVWDLKGRECRAEFVVGRKVWCGAFSERGESFLSGSEDGTLRLWSVDSGDCVGEVRAHQGSLWSLAVNESQNMVATAGDDGLIRLWQLPELVSPASPSALRSPRPYEAMNITGATGLTLEQRGALAALGAIEIPSP